MVEAEHRVVLVMLPERGRNCSCGSQQPYLPFADRKSVEPVCRVAFHERRGDTLGKERG
jgi:hypothetical protein